MLDDEVTQDLNRMTMLEWGLIIAIAISAFFALYMLESEKRRVGDDVTYELVRKQGGMTYVRRYGLTHGECWQLLQGTSDLECVAQEKQRD